MTATIGGVPLERLAASVGSTPFFAYDRALLSERVAELRRALPEAMELGYAVKANPMPAVVQHLSGLVDHFDVASAGEMQVALDTPIGAERVNFAGPGKTPAELRRAIAAGIMLELESETEAVRAAEIGAELGIRPRVAVRVNPDFQVKGSGMRMGGGPQQFGVDSERVPELLGEIAAAGLEFLGFHIFAGSQNLNAEILCEAQRKTVDLVLRLAESAPEPVRYLNLGGGFGIPYFERDEPLDLGPIAASLAELTAERIAPAQPQARVVLELGRYIVGECGFYVTRVVDRKRSREKTFLVVDGGLHHQLAASGNFGQVIRRNYPLELGGEAAGRGEPETVTVVGCLCTPLDLLGDDVELPRAEIGDLIVIRQAGAYGLTASPADFLGHPPAGEVLV
ncbi:MAG TPA: pyridoxal-dependent decarboxylase, exosortase A system-associated [Solirubrobacterales bacterium]|nr:pyridoxal-dependent decarboxylase, exosortase A system-associated [Solirubrobacterales bacterium]